MEAVPGHSWTRSVAAEYNGGMGLSDMPAGTAENTQGSGPWGQKEEVQTHLQKGLSC